MPNVKRVKEELKAQGMLVAAMLMSRLAGQDGVAIPLRDGVAVAQARPAGRASLTLCATCGACRCSARQRRRRAAWRAVRAD